MWVDPNLGRWSRTNALIARAARSLGVNVSEVCDVHTDHLLRLTRGETSVVVAKTRSPHLTAVANQLANHKYGSGRMLADVGLPVIPRVLVDDLHNPDQTRAAMDALSRSSATVVKPNWENRAHGVIAGVTSSEQLLDAMALAMELDRDRECVIEPLVNGANLRVSVVGDRVAACLVERPVVIGDGVRSLRDHIAELNADPRRGDYDDGALTPLDQIEITDDWQRVLGILGHRVDEPLGAGHTVEILLEESETIDVTGRLHPKWTDASRRACEVLGVDVGGVDFIVDDPSEPDGVLLEVNCLPALHLHALPTVGAPQPVFEAFVRRCLEPR